MWFRSQDPHILRQMHRVLCTDGCMEYYMSVLSYNFQGPMRMGYRKFVALNLCETNIMLWPYHGTNRLGMLNLVFRYISKQFTKVT